jgi:hypothetical protein
MNMPLLMKFFWFQISPIPSHLRKAIFTRYACPYSMKVITRIILPHGGGGLQVVLYAPEGKMGFHF